MASVRQRFHRFQAQLRIPKAVQETYGGRKVLHLTLQATDRRRAKIEAAAWESGLKAEWYGVIAPAKSSRLAQREAYDATRLQVRLGNLKAFGRIDDDPVLLGIEIELDKIAEKVGRDIEPSLAQEIAIKALNDAAAEYNGQQVKPRKELELSIGELADEYLKIWRTDGALKETNTEQQKIATFNLFAGYLGDRPIREVRKADAARFVDELKQLHPDWARSPKGKAMSWKELLSVFGGRPKGLSDSTINRHMATLTALWSWSEDREYCEGKNPFKGFRKTLKQGRNVAGYIAWSNEELAKLFDPLPARADLTEVMLVAMYTGMRLDEIASLEYGQIQSEDGVTFIHITDAKTSAGERKVPLHSQLNWLAARARNDHSGRVWDSFNPEGPGKKAGADAGKEFSRMKIQRGFANRQKAFHSFRKNVVGQLEENEVAENVVAQLVGHEKNFTFGTYGKTVSMQKVAAVIEKIKYTGLILPHPMK